MTFDFTLSHFFRGQNIEEEKCSLICTEALASQVMGYLTFDSGLLDCRSCVKCKLRALNYQMRYAFVT